MLLFIPYYVTKIAPKFTLKRWRNIFIECVIIILPFFFIKVEPSNLLHWFGWGLIIAVYALIVIFIFSYLFDRQVMNESLKRILSVVGRKT